MNESKRTKEDDSDSTSEEEEEMIVEDGEQIDVEFEGFSLSDDDFDGIRLLLTQLLSSKCEVSISQLVNALIGQNFIGTVLKQCNSSTESDSEDDDDVYGMVTCYSLTREKDDLTSSLVNHLIAKCKCSKSASNSKKDFEKVLTTGYSEDYRTSSSCVGLIFNERFVNVPPQAAVPMFDKLWDELRSARNKKHKSRFDFTHYVMICKVVDDFQTNKSQGESPEIFVNAEEELFAEEASISYIYSVPGDDTVSKCRRVLLLTSKEMERAVAKLKEIS